MSELASETFPKGALLAVGAIMAITVAGTGAARLARLSSPPAAVTAPPAAQAIDLRFADAADGSVQVSDARSGAAVGRLAPDTNGFVRGVMRGLARDRRARHIGEAPPFRLSRDAGGRLWLQDPSTGRLIDLEAFGQTNRDAFGVFLPADAPRLPLPAPTRSASTTRLAQARA